MKHREFHFFASSCAEWATTTDHRTLFDLLKIMESSKFNYRLWKVPGPWDADYKIMHYAPHVEGSICLGNFQREKAPAVYCGPCKEVEEEMERKALFGHTIDEIIRGNEEAA